MKEGEGEGRGGVGVMIGGQMGKWYSTCACMRVRWGSGDGGWGQVGKWYSTCACMRVRWGSGDGVRWRSTSSLGGCIVHGEGSGVLCMVRGVVYCTW